MKQQSIIKLLLPAIVAVVTIACGNPPQTTTNKDADHPQKAEAQPFRGEVYRSLDGETAITLISSEELELRDRKTTLLCKYSKQAGTLRVIINAMGTTQVAYYRFIDTGLQDNDGKVLFSPKSYDAALEQVRKKKELDEKVQQFENERDEATKLIIATFTQEKNRLLEVARKETEAIAERYRVISREINSSYESQRQKADETLGKDVDAAKATNPRLEKEALERINLEEETATKTLKDEIKKRITTAEEYKQRYKDQKQLQEIQRQYSWKRSAIHDKYGPNAWLEQQGKKEKAMKDEEMRLERERDEKIVQNNQLKGRELEKHELAFNKRLESLTAKRDADLSDLQHKTESAIEELKQKTKPTKQTTLTKADQEPKTKSKLVSPKLLNVWTLKIGSASNNAIWFIAEFENVGTASIKAFQGKWVVYDELDNVLAEMPYKYTSSVPYFSSKGTKSSHLIAPGEKICIVRVEHSNGEDQTYAATKPDVLRSIPVITSEQLEANRIDKKIKVTATKVVGEE
ncbi:MAG: hypothetical protein NT105_00055 [Verrucomicrobia bacterium]|nr:hypothetical protein [Verrucomicrobiota bacterium]